MADSRWAKRLKIELGMMHLNTPPIEHDSIINDYDNTISQVFRDDDNLSGGELTEAIKKALKESKVLVIILSKEMVADQNRKDAAHREAKAKLDEQLNAGVITQEKCARKAGGRPTFRSITTQARAKKAKRRRAPLRFGACAPTFVRCLAEVQCFSEHSHPLVY